jgi:hypothetical protein
MCTGAEIPAAAAMAAATAAGADTAATAGATGALASAGSAALSSAAPELLSSLPEMGALGGMSTADVPGLLSASPNLAGFESGIGAAALGGSSYPNASSGELASVGDTHNPMFYQAGGSATGGPNSGLMGAYDTMKPVLGRGADAMQNYQKFQTAQGLMGGGNRPAPAAPARPPSMNQQPQQTPFAQQFGAKTGMGDTMSAKLAILKRLGLLGGM